MSLIEFDIAINIAIDNKEIDINDSLTKLYEQAKLFNVALLEPSELKPYKHVSLRKKEYSEEIDDGLGDVFSRNS